MAFDRSLIERVEYVSFRDPALDNEHTDFNHDEYVRTLDRKYMPQKTGEDFAVFELEPLPLDIYQDVMKVQGFQRALECVAWGLKGLQNFRVQGRVPKLEFRTVGKQKRLTDRSLQQVLEKDLFFELGAIIMDISGLRPTSG